MAQGDQQVLRAGATLNMRDAMVEAGVSLAVVTRCGPREPALLRDIAPDGSWRVKHFDEAIRHGAGTSRSLAAHLHRPLPGTGNHHSGGAAVWRRRLFMTRSILCPVDLSEHSRYALRWAAVFATRIQSRLTVLSAVEPLLAQAAQSRFGQDVATSDTQRALEEFVATTWPDSSASASHTTLRVQVGNPADIILETAKTDAVDLIVMGTQGLQGFIKWVLGSTTERVLRHTTAPVLAVPWPSTGTSITKPADVPIDIGRILIATDFSEASLVAARFAVRLAESFSVPLSFAHIIESPIVPSRWRALMEDSGQERLTQARMALTQLAEQFAGLRDYETIAVAGRPSDAIGSVATDRGAQLIVMGLAGDLGRLAPRPGSIAYRTLCSSTIPVMVVPASVKLDA